MKLHVIQPEWSSGIPEQPEIYLDEETATAAWHDCIQEWRSMAVGRFQARTVEESEAAMDAYLDEAHPEGYGYGTTFTPDDDVTVRSWVIEIPGLVRERVEKASEESDDTRSCACTVTSADGALCLCFDPSPAPYCTACLDGQHTFDGYNRSAR